MFNQLTRDSRGTTAVMSLNKPVFYIAERETGAIVLSRIIFMIVTVNIATRIICLQGYLKLS
jgi:hypothetical protein